MPGLLELLDGPFRRLRDIVVPVVAAGDQGAVDVEEQVALSHSLTAYPVIA